MTNPITIHASAVNCVVLSNEMIIAAQTRTPNEDTIGTSGALNGRTALGCFTLMIHTPALTNTNANKVPMLVRSPVISPGNKVAKPPTNKNNIQLDLNGVLNFECNCANVPGNNPSFDMEKNTRL